MYSISKKKNKGKANEMSELDGFLMSSKNKMFNINGSDINNIIIIDRTLAYPLASRKALSKYERLLNRLTDLLIDDDDSGDSLREALNQIEKFRLEIKIKYRKFLKQKELEMMSKKLVVLQKEANRRLMEIQESYLEKENSRRSK